MTQIFCFPIATKMVCRTTLPPLPLRLGLGLGLPSFSISRRKPIFRRAKEQSAIVMSAEEQIVEHVVLFKVKPDAESSKVAAMVNGLNALTSLNLTLHLSAGQLLQCGSSSLTFTHMLHSRYATKNLLNDYAAHPDHVRVVTENVKPVVDDIMAVDWMSTAAAASSSPKPGSAIRVTFLKLKEGLGLEEKSRVLGVIGGIRGEFPAIEQLSVGENFSHERAKGFTIASAAVLPGPADLEALDSNAKFHKDKVKDFIDSVVVVDYVVPPPQAANL